MPKKKKKRKSTKTRIKYYKGIPWVAVHAFSGMADGSHPEHQDIGDQGGIVTDMGIGGGAYGEAEEMSLFDFYLKRAKQI